MTGSTLVVKFDVGRFRVSAILNTNGAYALDPEPKLGAFRTLSSKACQLSESLALTTAPRDMSINKGFLGDMLCLSEGCDTSATNMSCSVTS